MLEHLHIRNLALIEDMTLEFGEGINVLTGETGAGKSFIIKALGFVLGDRLTPDIVRPGADRAQVEAIFQIDGEDVILRRELMANSGRSRFYVNDVVSAQETLRELRTKLVSHTSQHAQQQLLQPAFQAALLEKNLDAPDLLQQRDDLLAKLKDTQNRIREIETRQARLVEKRELLEMQKSEIDKVNPRPGEEEKLEEQRAQARSNVSAKQNYHRAMSILHGDDGPGLIQMLHDFKRLTSMLEGDAGAEDVAEIDSCCQQIARIGANLPKPLSGGEKINMDAIEERLFSFAQLKRKLKRTLPEIMALKDEIKENLSFLDVCALDLGRLAKEVKRLSLGLCETVEKIAPLRRKTANDFAAELEAELRALGFSEHVRVIPDFESYEIWPGIKDERGRISWAPNPGQNAQPLDKIASGGELSRFLLALNTLDRQDKNLTFIFDEVDAGVGGLTLNKVADKLEDLANGNQVILITHWPQLAARARRHFSVRKEIREGNTYTLCSPLSGNEINNELYRMSGGMAAGTAAAKNYIISGLT